MAYASQVISQVIASRGDTFSKNSAGLKAPTQKAPARRGLFRRMLDAVIAVRQRQADREIARFLQSRGGKLTDEAEREIAQRFLPPSAGTWRA